MTKQATLADLPLGSTAVVLGYVDGPRARRRFIDMGLVPGARVTRLRAAPLGDPSLYAVFGGRLAVRRQDAEFVLIDVVGS